MRPKSPVERGTRWYMIGVLAAVLVSGILVNGWRQQSQGLAVTVFGAGRQASVLIVSDHRRVLFAAGTNGSHFANALADALPPVDKELDLVLILPAASEDVREAARALPAKVIWMLPEPKSRPMAETIERSFTLDFDERTRLTVSVLPDLRWRAILRSPAGTVHIGADGMSLADADEPAAVAILMVETDDIALDAPLAIGVTGQSVTSNNEVRNVGPGSSARLVIGADEIRLSSD